MNIYVIIFYFMILCGKEAYSLRVQNTDTTVTETNEENVELWRTFSTETARTVTLSGSEAWLEGGSHTLESTTGEVGQREDTTVAEDFSFDLQNSDGAEQSTLVDPSAWGAATQSIVPQYDSHEEKLNSGIEKESQIPKSFLPSTTESVIFNLNEQESTSFRTEDHLVDPRTNESSLQTTEIDSGDAVDLTGTEDTVFPTAEGQTDDAASLQKEKRENNQIFVVGSTSVPDEGTEGIQGVQSPEGAVRRASTSTPFRELVTEDQSHNEEEIDAVVKQSSSASKEGEVLPDNSSTRSILSNERFTTHYQIEDASVQRTEMVFDGILPENTSVTKIYTENFTRQSVLRSNSTIGKKFSLHPEKKTSRLARADDDNGLSFLPQNSNGTSAEADRNEPLREIRNFNKIDSAKSLKENREITPVKNSKIYNKSVIPPDLQNEKSILIASEKKTQGPKSEASTFADNVATASTPSEVALKNLATEEVNRTAEADTLLVSQRSSQDHLNATDSSLGNAAEIYIRLMKENQILRTLLYYIKTKASQNNTSEPRKNSATMTREFDAKNGEGEPLTETLTISTPVEIEISELDENNAMEESNGERLSSTQASIFETIEITERPAFSSMGTPSSEIFTTEINIPNDAENFGIETTLPPWSDHDDYLDVFEDFPSDTDSTDLAYAVNSTKIIPTKVVYSAPEPIPSDGKDELVFDAAIEPSIRKCCSSNQFFSLVVQSCHDSEGPTYFDFYVRELILGNKSLTLEFEYGRLSACPSTGEPPSIQVGISNYTHLLDLGYLYDVEMATHFDHESYCLEMVGNDAETAELTAAFCIQPQAPQTSTSSIRKCCPLHNFFDASQGVCMPQGQGVGEIHELVREFSGTYTDSTSIETGILTCKSGISNPIDISEAYLNAGDQLCIADSGHCYPSSLYCIEYVMEETSFHAQPMAVYCPLSSFKKCCPTHQILDNNICTDSEDPLSPYLTQLMATLYTQVGYPPHEDQVCVHLLLNSHNVRWWVTSSGYLSIDSGQNQIQTKNYCVDDSFENDEFVTIAHVCTDELKQSVGLPLSVFDKGTIGKCCPPDFHLSPVLRDCSHGKSYHVLDEDSLLMDANITKLGYTGFPHCESGKYHLYTFDKSAGDHVLFGIDSKLYVVSMDGKCIEQETALDNTEFCLDYGWDAQEPELASAIVCAPPEYVQKYHSEKFNLISALLGVSCCSLIIALVSLIYMRVRRGLVTVRKMNTLAGRILISYVTANFIGFLALAISMHVEAKEDTSVCMVLSGIVQFFLLSAFFWNTSICSESLFLTLRVSMSEGRRLAFHSLWAWGLPALITTIALTLDAYRDRLPCGTLTLRIGHLKCIFSDSDATLLYFYGPIALTLVANLVLLVAAKQARLSKLQRLEMGPRKPPSASNSVATDNQNRTRKTTVTAAPSPSHSGLRTHQNRNLWSESMRLVVWSGLTWVLEVIGFIIPRYVSLQQERWHDYLWYLPASVNSLRGFGIFFILVMTQETRSKILRALGTFKGKSSAMWKSERSQAPSKNNSYQPSSNNVSMNVSSSKYPVKNGNKTRNMSVATTMTNLTNLNASLHSQDGTVHPRLIHSISQMERRESTTSTLSSIGDEEVENLELGTRRRSSVAPLSLPSVDEEDDDLVEASLAVVPLPKGSPTDSVFARDSEA